MGGVLGAFTDVPAKWGLLLFGLLSCSLTSVWGYLHRAREDANEVDVTVLVVFVIHPLGRSPPLCAGGVGLWACAVGCCGSVLTQRFVPLCRRRQRECDP